jgi:hypothetical protein
MKTIIAGSRNLQDYKVLLIALEKCPWKISSIVSGMALGADMIGVHYANVMQLPLYKFPADWKTLGKSAGYQRNKQMALFGDACIVLWDGESKGSTHMINLAKKQKLPTIVYKYNCSEFEFFNLELICLDLNS